MPSQVSSSSLTEVKTTRFKTKVGADQKGDPSKIIGFKLVWTAVEFKFNGKCDQYVCQNSHYCLNSDSTVCSDMPQYCIDKTLVCNGVPNCSEEDYSDEDKCKKNLCLNTIRT
ncbi:CUB domain-containing protein [Trichonephila clavipes]|nr:CUB domain-containing protein [Trichonephila clavipes]